ncbi:hypothetical protein BC961_2199 [Flavobacterium weaverense]|uniref:Uncharacterized protein n=1 Tax=Flavobacterium weaverense TaxID=271156 RepID=A0A3L9ZWI7_9FLAO|nr:hypothetical protein BC961_2199 [Flavobacterium weaverense]
MRFLSIIRDKYSYFYYFDKRAKKSINMENFEICHYNKFTSTFEYKIICFLYYLC